MRDQIIRTAFHKKILQDYHQDSNSIVVDELGLKNGIIRADIAVLNGRLIGYEIKGERDNLRRFAPQVAAYTEIFENSYVIAAPKYLDKIKSTIPEFWGIYVINGDKEDITFVKERPALSNNNRNPYSVAQLLWKAEAAEILSSEFNCKIKSNYTKHQLYELLKDNCDINAITEIVLNCLKKREGWRINRQQLL